MQGPTSVACPYVRVSQPMERRSIHALRQKACGTYDLCATRRPSERLIGARTHLDRPNVQPRCSVRTIAPTNEQGTAPLRTRPRHARDSRKRGVADARSRSRQVLGCTLDVSREYGESDANQDRSHRGPFLSAGRRLQSISEQSYTSFDFLLTVCGSVRTPLDLREGPAFQRLPWLRIGRLHSADELACTVGTRWCAGCRVATQLDVFIQLRAHAGVGRLGLTSQGRNAN